MSRLRRICAITILGACRIRHRAGNRITSDTITLVNIDREARMLLAMDMREWVENDRMVHFILEAVDLVEITKFQIRGHE